MTILEKLLDGTPLAEELPQVEPEPEPQPEQQPRDWLSELRRLDPKYSIALEAIEDLEAISIDTEPARALLADYESLMQENEKIKNELGNLRPSPLLRDKVAELTAIRQALEPSAQQVLKEFLSVTDLLRLNAFYELQKVIGPLDQAIDAADSRVIAGLSQFDQALREAFAARQERQRVGSVYFRITRDLPKAGSFAEPHFSAPWGRALPRQAKDELERVMRRRFDELRQEKPGQPLTLDDFRRAPVGWR